MSMKSLNCLKSSGDRNNPIINMKKSSSTKVSILYHQKNKKSLKLKANPNYPILKKISDDLTKIDPEKLMLQTDPLLNSTKTIEQIQKYYFGIQKELNLYQIQEQKKKMINEKLEEVKKQIDEIVNPKTILSLSEINQEAKNYDYNNNINNSSSNRFVTDTKKENKPIIDYGVKIRSLEKELEYTYQGYNSIKSKNNKLINQLDELRKQNLYYSNKLNELKKVLNKSDEKFQKDKTKVEENLSSKDESQIFKQLLEKQKQLTDINRKMTENIKEINIELTQKKAKEKYLNFTKKKLVKKAEYIEKKRVKRLDDFNKELEKELDKIKDFKKESEILKNLDKQKLLKLEQLLNNIFEETRTDNSKQLIDFLSKSCQENLKFKDTIQILKEKVIKLEDEVSELEYIISFCEQQNEVKKKSKLGENEMNEIKKINSARDIFIKLQYNVIKDIYNNFTNTFIDLIKEFEEIEITNKNNINNDIIEFMHRINEKLRQFHDKLKKSGTNKEVFDFNKWNHKWDKINKVKEGMINNYMKTFGEGLKFDTKSIQDMVDEFLIKEKNNKDKNLNLSG